MWSRHRWSIHKTLSAAQPNVSFIVYIFDLEASSGNTFIVMYSVVLMAILSRKISCSQNGLAELPPPAESMH